MKWREVSDADELAAFQAYFRSLTPSKKRVLLNEMDKYLAEYTQKDMFKPFDTQRARQAAEHLLLRKRRPTRKN